MILEFVFYYICRFNRREYKTEINMLWLVVMFFFAKTPASLLVKSLNENSRKLALKYTLGNKSYVVYLLLDTQMRKFCIIDIIMN